MYDIDENGERSSFVEMAAIKRAAKMKDSRCRGNVKTFCSRLDCLPRVHASIAYNACRTPNAAFMECCM